MAQPVLKSQADAVAERQRRLAWERERIAEADDDIAAGRVIPDDELDAWLADWVDGKPVRIP